MAKEKKKWSKKKKIIVISLSVIFVLIAGIIGGGVYALNWYCAPISAKDTLSVSQSQSAKDGKEIRLIAHRGLSAQAPENTIASTTLAGDAGFWGAETDIYRTTDGKWVLLHDNYLYRLMDGSGVKKVESMTYNELLEYTYTNGANIDKYPNLKISLLEDFLDECAKYNMAPVIEYKTKKNYEYLYEVVEMIKERNMQDKVVFISFQIEALQELYKHTKDEIPLWYLMHKLDDEKLEEAKTLGKKAGVDFNANNGKTTREMVDKAAAAGLELGCWTVDDLAVVDEMVSWGVNTITTNLIVPDTKQNV